MTPELPSNKPKRRKYLPIVIGVVLVGVAVLLDHVTRVQRKGQNPFPASWAAAAPALLAGGAGGLPASSLYGLQRPKPPDPPDEVLTLDDFVGMLEKRVPAPVAQKVAKEFMKDPVLKEAWKQYRKQRGGKAPAGEFMDFVTRVPQFRQLMAKFQGDPSFKAAFGDLARVPKVDGVLRSALGAMKQHQGAGPVDVNAIVRDWKRKALSGVDLNKAARAPNSDRNFAPIRSSPDVQAGGRIGASGGNQALTGQSLGSGPGGHDVDQKLKAFKSAGEGGDKRDGWKKEEAAGGYVKKLLQWLEANGHGNARADIEALLGQEDFWGACFMSGHYNLCKEGCNKARVEGTSCVSASQYEACLGVESDSGRTPVKCIEECLNRYGESCPDKGIWDAACARGSGEIGCSLCLGGQDYGPPQTLADGSVVQPLGCRGGSAGATRQVAGPAAVTDPKDPGLDPGGELPGGDDPGGNLDCSKSPNIAACLQPTMNDVIKKWADQMATMQKAFTDAMDNFNKQMKAFEERMAQLEARNKELEEKLAAAQQKEAQREPGWGEKIGGFLGGAGDRLTFGIFDMEGKGKSAGRWVDDTAAPAVGGFYCAHVGMGCSPPPASSGGGSW